MFSSAALPVWLLPLRRPYEQKDLFQGYNLGLKFQNLNCLNHVEYQRGGNELFDAEGFIFELCLMF